MKSDESQSRSGDDTDTVSNTDGSLVGHYFDYEWGWWGQKRLGEPVDWHPRGKTGIKGIPEERAEAAFNLVRDFLAGQKVDPGLTALGVRGLIERSIARFKAQGGEYAEKQVAELDAMLAAGVRSERGLLPPAEKIMHIDCSYSGVGGNADVTPFVTVLFASGDFDGRDAFAKAIGYPLPNERNRSQE